VTGLAAGHAVTTFVGCLIVFISNLTACADAEAVAHVQLMFAGFCGLAVVGLAVWGVLAVRWRRPWLLGAGAVVAAPALWFAANVLVQPLGYCK
jgi:predicted CDP-diglyceride synthetase/phosphatidate cytidylyltransferase